ncbi:Pkinase-domain-containing protein [Gonapodya prolifera JEL478]|uniref:Pkinase-domain-containing protein n=1 Tax=Gonapodya prolifera (strain JEL478) TaxID=1344416 RepID=A0A139AP53_GONPJ|nr:Pkinase-domain-containing protein [Gonapodya prolifera JEL478]|eukprot:KXS18516.1 Pkinase-domain-containing protein [Gonapodya prolifera JEL478]
METDTLPSFGIEVVNRETTKHEDDEYIEILDGGIRTSTFFKSDVEEEGLPVYPDLQRFKLLKKMGEGAFSNVYKAKDRQTQQIVAVKVVRKAELTPNQRANVLKEVQLLRTLKHDNIIRLLGFHDTMSRYYYLILELMPGGELFHELVRQTCLSEDECRRIITMIASAVRYLHEDCGVVHRDIKLENLLFDFPKKNKQSALFTEKKAAVPPQGALGCKDVTRVGVVKLADFGLSKTIWNDHTLTPCGTVGYTAPEIVRDEWYSKGVDMWALGCVLYTLLCGFPPFYDDKVETLTKKVARGQFTFLSPWWDPVSAEARDLVTRCLTVDPSRRYTIRQFLAHPWMRKQVRNSFAIR